MGLKRTVTFIGPFTNRELRRMIEVVQQIEQERPKETFHVLLEDPEETRRAEDLLEEINPLRKGYERLIKIRRRDTRS